MCRPEEAEQAKERYVGAQPGHVMEEARFCFDKQHACKEQGKEKETERRSGMAVTAPESAIALLDGLEIAQGKVETVVHLFNGKERREMGGYALIVVTESKQSGYGHGRADNKGGHA